MIYGYIRVSSDKQTVENQRFEIEQFCIKQQLFVDGWIEETISGTTSYTKRRLGYLLRNVKKGDIIICSELSRLGRNLFMIMEILNVCMHRECRLWTIKDNYRLGDDINAKVLAFAFGLSAEIERNLISQRTKDALAKRKAEGMKLGRKRGSTLPLQHLKIHRYRRTVQRMLANGASYNSIAKKTHTQIQTVRRYIDRMQQEESKYTSPTEALAAEQTMSPLASQTQ